MSAPDLIKLADRCEAAGGPDREIDCAIKEALGLAWDYAADWGPRGNDAPVAFPYTASIDAAMMLVPDGHFWSITMRGENRGGFHACCQSDGPLDWREGATAPLAMCAAALRAIATQQGDQPNG